MSAPDFQFPPFALPVLSELEIELTDTPLPEPPSLLAILAKLQKEQAKRVPVKRPAQWGDCLTLSLDAKVGKIPLPDYRFEVKEIFLDPSLFLAGFAQALVGLQANQTKAFRLVLPEDYPYADWRKQTASFQVKVHKVEELHYPLLNEEWAPKSGYGQTLQEVEAALIKAIEQLAQQRLSQHVVDCILDAILESTQISLPLDWVEQHLRQLWYSSEPQMQTAKLPADVFEQAFLAWQALHPIQTTMERNLKQGLVYQHILTETQIQLTQAELDAYLAPLLEKYGYAADEGLRLLGAEQKIDELKVYLLRQKAEAYLLQNVQIRWAGEPFSL